MILALCSALIPRKKLAHLGGRPMAESPACNRLAQLVI